MDNSHIFKDQEEALSSFNDSDLSVLDLEVEEKFKKNKEMKKINFFNNHYVNNIALNILANLIEFSQKYNKSHQIHVCFKPLILYIFDRILKLTEDQFNIFLKTNLMIERNYLQDILASNKLSLDFSIQCSSDVAYRYNLNKIEEIDIDKEDYYKVECKGLDEIEYKCSNYYVILAKFFSINDVYYDNVPFSVLENPTIYVYRNRLFKDIDIYLIKLYNEGEFLLIFPESDVIKCHNFLISVNIEDILRNSKLSSSIKWLILPLMTEIETRYSNVHRVIEDIEELRDFLFIDKNNNKQKCKNFEFQIYSKMRILNHHNDDNTLKNIFVRDYLIFINNPFLYLFLNNNFVVKSGGVYDAHMKLKDQSHYQKVVINEKF